MKTGRTLQEVASELQRQKETKRDYIADTRQLLVLDGSERLGAGNRVSLKVNSHGTFEVDSNAARQIAQRVGIPQRYFDRMAEEAPKLLAENVNHWFESKPEARMVRTLDGRARAFLSNRYRRLDNFDCAQVALETLGEVGIHNVESCEVTAHRIYIKSFFPSVEGEVRVGEVVRAGIFITNDEVGGGRLKVRPMTLVLKCKNGAIHDTMGVGQFHVGRQIEGDGEEVFEIFSDETLKADDAAIWLKVRDTIRACSRPELFRKVLEAAQAAAGQPITGDPVKAVEVLQKTFSLPEGERGGILGHLIRGGDLTRWGLSNAVTRFSQDVGDYGRATELEAIGGAVIELANADWRKIAEPSLN